MPRGAKAAPYEPICYTGIIMAKIRNEYVVQVHPGGTWIVSYCYDEDMRVISSGRENTMEQAEAAARLMILKDQARKIEIAKQQNSIKEFTVQA